MGKPKAELRGAVQIVPLNTVEPNDWNPNELTAEMKESLKHGLIHDGWLVSQALLVWGSDEKGEKKRLIIDGEHRYLAARELHMPDGPMVILEGITEEEAKGLTVKLNQKRGHWNEDALAELLKDLAARSPDGITGIDLGFADEALMKLLAEPVMDIPAPDPANVEPHPTNDAEAGSENGATPEASSVRMVQLFLDDVSQPIFLERVRRLSEKWGTKNVTDTVLRAIEELVEIEDGAEKMTRDVEAQAQA